jgi:hypothetical protein
MIAKNIRQVVNQVVETLADAPKQEERKLNLCLTSFETKEGKTEKELVQCLNTELLQGQMRLWAKVVAAMRQRPAIAQASTSTMGVCPGAMLLKFAMSKDHQATLQRRKGLVGTKLNLDEDLTPTQHVCKSKLWSIFKEAKVANKRAF